MKSIQEAFSLKDRVAFIAGGGTGIGRQCALVLAGAGAKVFFSARRENKLAGVRDEISAFGGVCGYYPADLTDETACKRAVDACMEQFGRIDIIVNSAGSVGRHETLEEEFNMEYFHKTMAVDLDATMLLIKNTYEALSKNKVGSVINIASLAALRASGPLAYTAAKGAIRSTTKVLAKRLGPMSIRVNTVYPGFVITEMTEGVMDRPELKKHFEDESPLGLIGEAVDIAWCVLYLASDASRFVTGQDFVVDGGAMCG